MENTHVSNKTMYVLQHCSYDYYEFLAPYCVSLDKKALRLVHKKMVEDGEDTPLTENEERHAVWAEKEKSHYWITTIEVVG